jgi:hypothetical protein
LKRIALALCICGVACAAAAPASFGFLLDFDYVGTVKGQEASEVGFKVKKSASGRKQVTDFTVLSVAYECSDAASGVTSGGWVLDRKMRIKARSFEGEGDWVGLPFDPVGKVSGKLKPGGIAKGSFKMTGELAGPGTHCKTGLVDWRATRNELPF